MLLIVNVSSVMNLPSSLDDDDVFVGMMMNDAVKDNTINCPISVKLVVVDTVLFCHQSSGEF